MATKSTRRSRKDVVQPKTAVSKAELLDQLAKDIHCRVADLYEFVARTGRDYFDCDPYEIGGSGVYGSGELEILHARLRLSVAAASDLWAATDRMVIQQNKAGAREEASHAS